MAKYTMISCDNPTSAGKLYEGLTHDLLVGGVFIFDLLRSSTIKTKKEIDGIVTITTLNTTYVFKKDTDGLD